MNRELVKLAADYLIAQQRENLIKEAITMTPNALRAAAGKGPRGAEMLGRLYARQSPKQMRELDMYNFDASPKGTAWRTGALRADLKYPGLPISDMADFSAKRGIMESAMRAAKKEFRAGRELAKSLMPDGKPRNLRSLQGVLDQDLFDKLSDKYWE